MDIRIPGPSGEVDIFTFDELTSLIFKLYNAGWSASDIKRGAIRIYIKGPAMNVGPAPPQEDR